jgi:hypothetical protein
VVFAFTFKPNPMEFRVFKQIEGVPLKFVLAGREIPTQQIRSVQPITIQKEKK